MSRIGNFFKRLFKKPKSLTANAQRYQDFSYSLFDNSSSDLLRALTPSEFLMFGLCVRAVQLIANDVAKVNFNHRITTNTGEWENLQHSNVLHLLNEKPNNTQTPWEFKKTIIWNLLLYGCAPILILRDEYGDALELLPVYPYYIQKEENDGEVSYTYLKTKNPFKLDKDEVIWIDYELIDGFDNLSIRTLFKSTIAKVRENELSTLNAIRNDLRYNMFVKIKDATNKEQREAANQALSAMVREQKRTGSFGIVIDEKWDLGKASDVINIQVDFQTRNQLGREFAASLGIPPSKLGIDDPNKYNSSAELNRAYVDNSLKPLLINICQKITQVLLPHREQVTFKVLDLLSVDIKAVQEFAASAINNGYATANEIRELLGFDKHPDGDKLLANGTLTPVSFLSQETNQDNNTKEVKND
ncbi:Hypothetical protein, putative phage portal protein [Mycoplasmopsis bovigenitalium 51080]|uniref:Phage portal protein n=1 Tax=Mycoplasmopsis bovigenitalium 51080 TaxID=1188235 RepID=N9VBF2_9BACT|nr:phage portal protein [Mycoplasmopsis bovigenitalium]ENY69023.1 Hypothetical protein, putative phage portal protein [Mycoplasmopsis bovigenitalium 51080]